MSLNSLKRPINIVKIVLIAVAIINFILLIANRKEQTYIYGIIINWIFVVMLMIVGIDDFPKKRSRSIFAISGAVVVAVITIWQMTLFY